MRRGKLIVFYGINRLGKTTQAKILVDKLNSFGYKTEHIKYALYDLKPSGPLINSYLREGNPYHFTPREYQILQVLNRQHFEPILLHKINSGINIVAEDYTGTGISWGIAAGVDKKFLLELNSPLLEEDIAFLFIGDQFESGREPKHIHEENKELTKSALMVHLKIAKGYNWIEINANQPINKISDKIFKKVKRII